MRRKNDNNFLSSSPGGKCDPDGCTDKNGGYRIAPQSSTRTRGGTHEKQSESRKGSYGASYDVFHRIALLRFPSRFTCSHTRTLSRNCFIALAMTCEGLLSLQCALRRGDAAISALMNSEPSPYPVRVYFREPLEILGLTRHKKAPLVKREAGLSKRLRRRYLPAAYFQYFFGSSVTM